MNKPKRKPIQKTQEKYIDDMTQCVAMNLKEVAELNPDQTTNLPKQYHERTGHILKKEHNIIQKEVDKLIVYAEENKMNINETKTKIMMFNQARKIDILPEVKLNGNNIEVVDEAKLLGVMISNNLTWQKNTQFIISKSYQRMWILRNLKKYGADDQTLLEAYGQQIRTITEMACPAWNGALTREEVWAIERIQKTALSIIRAERHTTYKEALEYFNIETLEARRKTLCIRFAIKTQKNSKFSHWFQKTETSVNTRSIKMPFVTQKFRTMRFKKSPIPYLTDLLNAHLLSK